MGRWLVLEGAEGDQFCPPSLQQVQRVLVIEAECLVLRQCYHCPFVLGFYRKALLRYIGPAGLLGDCQNPVQVDGLFHLANQAVIPVPGHGAFHRGDQSQVPLRLHQFLPPGQVAQHRQPRGGLDLGFAEVQMPRPANAVEHNPRDVQVRVELLVPQHLGRHAAGHLGSVCHKDHRGLEQLGKLGGGTVFRQVGVTVKHPHHPLHHRELPPAGSPAEKLQDRGMGKHPRIQVPAGHAAGQSVIAGVDVVGTGLEGLDRKAAPGQGRHDARGDGRLADAAPDPGNHYGGRGGIRP